MKIIIYIKTKLILIFSIGILSLILIIFPETSIAINLFETNFNKVNFESDNIDSAKIKKINNLKISNLNIIFKKILIDKEYKKIRRNLDKNFANFFIKNILIEDEKIINNKYSSKIKINFDKNLIVNYLRINKISYIEKYPQNYLTIIYEEDEFNNNLLSKNNSFYKFLINNNKKFQFYFLPKLDINDRYLFSNKDLKEKDIKKINLLSDKYNNKNVILINSEKINNEYNIESFLIYNKNIYLTDIYKSKNLNFNIYFNSLIDKITDKWKEKNLIQNVNLNYINCIIHSLNLYELKEIKSKIMEISIIYELNLKQISLNNNTYQLSFFGNKNVLYDLLSDKEIDISNNNGCEIRLK